MAWYSLTLILRKKTAICPFKKVHDILSVYHQIKSDRNLLYRRDALNGEATRLRNKRQGEPVSRPLGLAVMVKVPIKHG